MSKKPSKREQQADSPLASVVEHPTARPDSKTVVYYSLGLLTLVLLLYARAANFPLIQLDDASYVNNVVAERGLTWEGILWAFGHQTPFYWHPLTWLSFMLDASFFGADATGGPHIVNAILHGLNSILVLLLLRKLTGKMHESALAALVFAVHPLRVESVVWLAERKDVLCTFFSLLSLWLYAQYASKPFHAARYAAFAVAGMCAMMAKPMAVTLPFVMLLLDWWPFARVRAIGKCIAEKIPLVAFAGFTSWQIMQSNATEAAASISGLTLGVQAANAITAYARYLLDTIWPYPLALYYPYSTAIPVFVIVASAAVIIGITLACILQYRRRPYLLTGWFWFVGMLVPVSGFVQSGMTSRADRFTYLPHVGLLMAAVLLVSDLLDSQPARKRQAVLAVIAFAVFLAAMTSVRLNDWSDVFKLYSHDLAITGENPRLQFQYGLILQTAGRAVEAETQFRAILKSNPNANAPRLGLASALVAEQRFAESVAVFRDVLKAEPAVAEAHMGLAIAEMNFDPNAGDGGAAKDDAIAHFNEALRLGLPPAKVAQIHNNLGVIFIQKKDPQNALPHFREALSSDPSLLSARRNIGLALIETNQREAAADFLEQSIRQVGSDTVLVNLRDSLSRPAPAK